MRRCGGRVALARRRSGHHAVPQRRGSVRGRTAPGDRHRRASGSSGRGGGWRDRRLCRRCGIVGVDRRRAHELRRARDHVPPPLVDRRARGSAGRGGRPHRRGRHQRPALRRAAAPPLRRARRGRPARLPRPAGLPAGAGRGAAAAGTACGARPCTACASASAGARAAPKRPGDSAGNESTATCATAVARTASCARGAAHGVEERRCRPEQRREPGAPGRSLTGTCASGGPCAGRDAPAAVGAPRNRSARPLRSARPIRNRPRQAPRSCSARARHRPGLARGVHRTRRRRDPAGPSGGAARHDATNSSPTDGAPAAATWLTSTTSGLPTTLGPPGPDREPG